MLVRVGEFGEVLKECRVIVGTRLNDVAEAFRAELRFQSDEIFDWLIVRELRMSFEGLLQALLFEPILVIVMSPARQVVFVQAFARLTKTGDDLGVRETVVEHEVNLLPHRFGEVADFAGAAAPEGAAENGEGIEHG